LDPFLSMQHTISAGLSETEVSAMKFLCRDKIRKRKLEAVQSGLDLCTILMELQLITRDDVGFLKKLLQHIERGDLLALVVHFEEGRPHANDDQPDVHERPGAVICDNVGREWKKLMRELGMPEVKLDRIEADHRNNLYEQLVQALRQWQTWKGKDAKVADLIEALRGCNLNLVADRVEE
ncbi:FADD protein, partial [Drymodes brunneopygia]|nr:FADD protein [Drymodes brunneopygia]